MGMLLSRFRAVIFPRRGRLESGGLASEPVVAPTADEVDHEDTGATGHTSVEADTERQDERGYYGLHWRKELNWRALGFEYVEDGDEERKNGPERPVFHA
jgi:tRNA-specific adenosine deaminase 3